MGGTSSSSRSRRRRLASAGEREVQGSHRLASSHRFDEGVLRHRLEGVVRGALLADGGLGGGRHVLPTCGASPVSRIDPGGVGQGEEPVVDRSVEASSQLFGCPADRGQEIRPPHVTDEQGVASEDAPRLVLGTFVHDEGDRLGRVTRRGPDLDDDIAERQRLTVGERLDREVGQSPFPVGDGRAGGGGELQVPGDEVGVEVRLEDPFDPQPVLLGVGEVLARCLAADRRPRRDQWSRRRSCSCTTTGKRAGTGERTSRPPVLTCSIQHTPRGICSQPGAERRMIERCPAAFRHGWSGRCTRFRRSHLPYRGFRWSSSEGHSHERTCGHPGRRARAAR